MRRYSALFATRIAALMAWEIAFAMAVNHYSSRPRLCALLRMISRLGDGWFWYALMAALLAKGGWSAVKPVAHMVAVGTIGVLVYKWLKGKTLRPRPYQVRSEILAAAEPLDQFSFPSGHALHAVSFSIVAVAYFPALAPLLALFVLLVLASRVVLGLHYPSDVLAGAAIGALIASASFAFV